MEKIIMRARKLKFGTDFRFRVGSLFSLLLLISGCGNTRNEPFVANTRAEFYMSGQTHSPILQSSGFQNVRAGTGIQSLAYEAVLLGQTWVFQHIADPFNGLGYETFTRETSCDDSDSTCTAIGGYMPTVPGTFETDMGSVMMKSNDHGATWYSVLPFDKNNTYKYTSTNDYTCITGTQNCIVVGQYALDLPLPPGSGSKNANRPTQGAVSTSSDKGRTWTAPNIFSSGLAGGYTYTKFDQAYCFNSSHCFLAVRKATDYATGTPVKGTILRSSDKGVTWSEDTNVTGLLDSIGVSDGYLAQNSKIFSIKCTTVSNCVAVGMVQTVLGGIFNNPNRTLPVVLRSTDSGVTWTQVTSPVFNVLASAPNTVGSSFTSLECKSAFCIASAIYKTTTNGPQKFSFIFRSTDSGLTWTQATIHLTPGLSEVDYSDSIDSLACVTNTVCGGAGSSQEVQSQQSTGAFWASEDAGLTWDKISIPGVTHGDKSLFQNIRNFAK